MQQDDGGKKHFNDAQSERPQRGKTRTRPVDFMRVEDTMHGQPLSPFELKVKAKIACSPSPYEEITRREDEKKKREEVKRRLAGLVERARLTRQQQACYQLAYGDGLSSKEIATSLGIREANVRRLKQSILKALRRVHEKQRIKENAERHELTEKQRLVVSLFYGEQISRAEIGKRLGMSVVAVEKMLGRIRKKIF